VREEEHAGGQADDRAAHQRRPGRELFHGAMPAAPAARVKLVELLLPGRASPQA
jgi:hypothetical protein